MNPGFCGVHGLHQLHVLLSAEDGANLTLKTPAIAHQGLSSYMIQKCIFKGFADLLGTVSFM